MLRNSLDEQERKCSKKNLIMTNSHRISSVFFSVFIYCFHNYINDRPIKNGLFMYRDLYILFDMCKIDEKRYKIQISLLDILVYSAK